MPYRAIFITLVTVMLALLAASLWMRAVSPLLLEVNTSTQPSTKPGDVHPGITMPAAELELHGAVMSPILPFCWQFPTSIVGASIPGPERPDRQFKALIKAVMIATMLILTLLFAIGLFTTFRAWLRTSGRPKRTRYVDAWKIAGERLQAKGDDTNTPMHE